MRCTHRHRCSPLLLGRHRTGLVGACAATMLQGMRRRAEAAPPPNSCSRTVGGCGATIL